MHSRNSPRRAVALALFATAFTMAGAAAAHAADKPGVDAGRHPMGSACEAARQQAWFQRQLRTTEGDTEPLEPMAPPECAPMARHGTGANTQAANADPGSAKTQVR